MSAIEEYLAKTEWTMGTGQCHHCLGNSPRFHHSVFGGWMPAGEIGHTADCQFVAMTREAGMRPRIMKGFWRPGLLKRAIEVLAIARRKKRWNPIVSEVRRRLQATYDEALWATFDRILER